MTLGDRERLLRRIRQMRRTAAPDQPPTDAGDPGVDRLEAVEARVRHLEQLLEGLQDSVYREAARQAELITELQAKVEPGAMGAALAEDRRKRGL
jgi:hypothetical protein